MAKWIKVPGAGEFRGEGEWVEARDSGYTEEEVRAIEESNFLPVVESDEKPEN
jgi:hypothetical protein